MTSMWGNRQHEHAKKTEKLDRSRKSPGRSDGGALTPIGETAACEKDPVQPNPRIN